MWTPEREDLATELCGEIEDEDKGLVERAEERAERFGEYSGHRAEDAERANDAISAIADNIPFGQPILVGHHSEKRARRDAQKIENGMRFAVKMWETSEYWTRRAEGAIHAAKYKERPDVRARRIKKLEADKRRQERSKAEAEKWLRLWTNPEKELTLERAVQIANVCYLYVDHTDGHDWTAYDVLRPDGERYKACPAMTPSQVQEIAKEKYPRTIAYCERWIQHYTNRVIYERAMLGEVGGTAADKKGPEVGGAVKCWATARSGGWGYIVKVNKVSVSLEDNWGNGGGNFKRNIPFDKLSAIMTKAEVEEKRAAGQLAEFPDKTGFIIIGSKQTTKGPDGFAKPQNERLEAMKEALKAGVEVIVADRLFPTPPELAARMVELAEISPDHRVLEPSAGTGAILHEIPQRPGPKIVAVEINKNLFDRLICNGISDIEYIAGDFLSMNGNLGKFDRILMNPPFKNAIDIQHIKHAMTFLNDGGRIVAICANGSRQREALKPLASSWEDLPEGSFKDSGTMVSAALIIIEKGAQ